MFMCHRICRNLNYLHFLGTAHCGESTSNMVISPPAVFAGEDISTGPLS